MGSSRASRLAPHGFLASRYATTTGEQEKGIAISKSITVCLTFAWHLDDYPFFEYVASRKRVSPGLADPSRVFEVWTGDFDYLSERIGDGVFILTMHPQVIGRGHRLLMLERVIEHIRNCDGVVFSKMEDVAREWRRAHPLEPRSKATD